MQHPIGEHALLADSRTAALIDPDGNVAWLCWPWIDSTPLFFSILDEARGGMFSVRPARPDARVVSRRYHSRSLVLETVWQVGSARLIVDDALDLANGPLLIRAVRAEGGAVAVMVASARRRGRGPPWRFACTMTSSSWKASPRGGACAIGVDGGGERRDLRIHHRSRGSGNRHARQRRRAATCGRSCHLEL